MKLKDLLERVKGGKLDPLSKMGKSKLTGQEVAQYYRKNPKAKQAARDPMVKKAIELALDLGGNQTLAVKEIEKIKKGLSKNSAVASALRTANEDMTGTSSVAMPDGIPLGKVRKRKDLEEETLVENKVRYQTFFGKDRMGVTATAFAEYTKHIAKKFKIKIVKTPNPKGPNHLTFEAPEKDMKKFQQFLKKNLVKNAVPYIQKKNAGEPYNEQKEKLSPAKKQYYDFNIMRTKLYRFVKAKTKAHKFGIDDLMLMTSPKVIEGMYKQNPRGFTRMLDKMYPNEKAKMTKMDFTVLGDFIDARGKVIKGQGDKVDESTSLIENKDYIRSVKGGYAILYRVKNIQTPELNKFKSSAKLMKLKIDIKQSPNKKETLIRLQGNRKQLRDLDAVVRGKSSYGDPSLAMQQREDAVERAKEIADLKAKHKREIDQEKDEIERTKDTANTESVLAQLDSLEEQIDLIEQSLLVERQFRLNPHKKPSLFTQWYSKKNQKDKRTKNMAKSMYSPEDVIEYHFNAGNLKPGKNFVKDTGASLLARSLGKIMNDERKKARDKGAAFGKGDRVDEMDAPRIKKIIDTIGKGLIINVKKKGKDNVTFLYDRKQVDLFYDLDTYTRDIVWDIMQMGSDGTFYQAVYGEPDGRTLDLKFPDDDDRLVAQTESTELNEESATMKKVRQVIKKKGMMNIDGMKLDLTTASMIASVYDKVNPQNKKRMDSLKLPQLVNLTMKVAGKARKESVELQEMRPNKDQMPTIGWDAGKQMYRVTMLDKRTGKKVKTSHIPVSKDFPAPKDKSKINAKELGKAIKSLEKKMGVKIGVDESRDLPFSLSILERMSKIQNKSTDFIKVPKLTSIEQGRMSKIKKRFPKLPEPVVYEIMRLTHKGNKVDSRKFVEIGNLYDKDYVGGTGGKFIQKLRNMGARLPQGHMGEETISEGQTYKSIIQGLEKDKKEISKKSKAFGQNDTKFVDKAINFLKQLEKEGIPAGQISQVDFVTNRVPKFFVGRPNRSPSFSKFTPNDVKKAVAHAKKMGIMKEAVSPAQQAAIAISKKERGEKPEKTENRARRDAMRDMGKRKDKEDDGYGTATDDDRKAADKNVIMQIRRVADLPKGGQVELPNGKKVKMDRKSAIALNKKFDSIRKPQDKLKLQKMMNDKKISVVALKRLLGK